MLAKHYVIILALLTLAGVMWVAPGPREHRSAAVACVLGILLGYLLAHIM